MIGRQKRSPPIAYIQNYYYTDSVLAFLFLKYTGPNRRWGVERGERTTGKEAAASKEASSDKGKEGRHRGDNFYDTARARTGRKTDADNKSKKQNHGRTNYHISQRRRREREFWLEKESGLWRADSCKDPSLPIPPTKNPSLWKRTNKENQKRGSSFLRFGACFPCFPLLPPSSAPSLPWPMCVCPAW